MSQTTTTPPLPSDAPMLLAELARMQLSEKAIEHLRAYSKFYLWAVPLFELGHIHIFKRTIEFDLAVSKRFMIGKDVKGDPVIEVQPPEMAWMSGIPFVYAGVHFKSSRIVLFSRPEQPLSSSGFIIPIDIREKIEFMKGREFLTILETQFFPGSEKNSRKIRLQLKEIDDGFFTKKKHKNTM